MTNITIIISSQNTTQLYRKPHDLEIIDYDSGNWNYGGDGYRLGKVRGAVLDSNKGMPEVYRLDDQQTLLDCGWQRLWRAINPKLSDGTWGSLLGNSLAWTNRTGFPGRYNCITGEDFGQKNPAFNSSIVNGGAVLKCTVQGDSLLVNNLMVDSTPPPAEEMLESPWLWFWGTTILPSGKINYMVRKGTDGLMYPVRVPFVTESPVLIPIEWMHKLPLNSPIPDARWLA